ncbi:MAG: PAS domain-containing sensor histidine kinase [Rhodocyclaceae bacterium]|nr:PAS domain-containing sensor histidine kinase [Rhodocyclaceae bacterium]
MESAQRNRTGPPLRGYLWASLGTLAGTLALSPARTSFDLSNVALLYVLAVVVVAASFGRGPAVAAAVLASLCFAYVFVPPDFSLAITEAQYLLSAIIMPVVAVIVGHLTSRLKQQAELAGRKTAESTSLYSFARQLAGAATPGAVVEATGEFLARSFDARQVRVFFPDEFASAAGEVKPALLAQCAAHNAFLSCPSGKGRFQALLPLTAASGVQGVLVFDVDAAALSTQDAVEYVETVASVLAVALERSHFAERARETEVMHAAESLRNSILSALSHDLRTPLTALVGMAEAVALGKATPERQKHMLEAIRNQAVSISRQTTNLLDMARLSAGRLRLNTAWQPVEEVLGATLQQVRTQWKARELRVDVAKDLPPINIDAVLIERVLWNLVENAMKYAPAEAPIEILVRRAADRLEIAVCDAGPGLPAEHMERIFDLFQRGRAESDIPGLGLGLAIARTIVDAHGGGIAAENREGGGTCFRIGLPIGDPPNFDDMEGQP